MKPTKLFKATIEIWSAYDPRLAELEDLARDATSGDALCERMSVELATDPDLMPDTDFFGWDEDENQNQ